MRPVSFNLTIVAALAVLVVLIPRNVQAEEAASSTPDLIIVANETSSSSTVISTLPMELAAPSASSTPPIVVDMHVRYQDAFVFSGAVTTTPRETMLDSSGVAHVLSASSSVLTALADADILSDQLAVTDLQYFDAYKSFYLNCLSVLANATSTSACGNWNYVVNGTYPSLGMDSYKLQGGESVYVYFGNSWNITASTSTFPVSTTTTLSTWRYNYNDLASEWLPDSNDTVDIAVPNPNPTGWRDATLTASTLTTNASGTVDYVFSSTGTYYAKVTSSDYSKWSPAITLNVVDRPVTATSTATSTPSNSNGSSGNDAGSGGGSGGNDSRVNATSTPATVSSAVIEQSAQSILNFLKSRQADDGKIIDGGTTDWAIMSWAAHNEYAGDIKKSTSTLLSFAKGYSFTDSSDLNICASYPRHVLALLAAGVNSTDSLIKSLTEKIRGSECYKNNLYGQNGINDDVFALLSLLAVDTSPTEPIITDIVSSTLKDQTAEGSFTWAGYASPDITGAAVNALHYAFQKGVIVPAEVFSKAKAYLKAQQLADGGWGLGQSDALTTSWAIMGINALGEGQADWLNSQNKNPWTALTSQLNSNGYYEPSWAPGTVDWFGTKHAIPALLGKAWPVITSPRQEIAADTNIPATGGGGGSVMVSEAPATSTLAVAIPTLENFATSTAPVLILKPASSTIPIIENTIEPKAPRPLSALLILPKASVKLATRREEEPVLIQQPLLAESKEAINVAPVSQLDPLLPIEKKVAATTAAGSALIFSGTSLILLLRLLLAAI